MATDALIAQAVTALQRSARVEPDALAFAPGRVNLIGDHTDYNGGLALPGALELGCVAAVAWGNRRPGIHAIASDLDEVAKAPIDPRVLASQLDDIPHWARYIAGVIALATERLPIDVARGIVCSIASSVPIGGGLSSSAAIEVAVATALEALTNTHLDPLDKAHWCQEAEHRFAGTPCGLLDQLASIHGQQGSGLAIDFADLSVRHISLPPEDIASFVLFDSCVRHENTGGAYADRRAACERVRRALNAEHLARVSPEELASRTDDLDPSDVRRARHVLTESQRVQDFTVATADGNLAVMGRLMLESHASIAQDFAASVPTIDRLVALLVEDPGIFGARMTGGGFGGYVVALLQANERSATLGRLTTRIEHALGIRSNPRVIRFGSGATSLTA